jgi:hypothetical protein
MIYRCPGALVFAWLLLGAGLARSQDRIIFVDDCMGTLQAAVYTEHLTLENGNLRRQISDRRLAALMIPDVQPAGQFVVLTCAPGATALAEVKLGEEDVNRLRRFGSDDIFLALTDVARHENNFARIRDLKQRVDRLPADRRATAERFIGARLAECNLTPEEQKQLRHYTMSYEQYQKKKRQQTKPSPGPPQPKPRPRKH